MNFEVTNNNNDEKKKPFFYVNRNYFANENFNTQTHTKAHTTVEHTVGNYAFVSLVVYIPMTCIPMCMYARKNESI